MRRETAAWVSASAHLVPVLMFPLPCIVDARYALQVRKELFVVLDTQIALVLGPAALRERPTKLFHLDVVIVVDGRRGRQDAADALEHAPVGKSV